MSSTAYFAEITPDPFLRRIVFCSGLLLAAAACLVILNLPTGLGVRLSACVGWLAMSIRELLRFQRAWVACQRLRFSAGGEIEVLAPDGKWYEASWASGSVLLRRTGWIRLRNRGGAPFGELLRGDARTSADWRRLQVIWRHVGA